MWSREQLKDKAKQALKLNYWKVILVTFLVTIVIGGTATVTSSASSGLTINLSDLFSTSGMEDGYDYDYDYETNYDGDSPYEYSDQYSDMENSDDYWEGYWDAVLTLGKQDGMSSDYYDGYNDGYIDTYVAENEPNLYPYVDEEDIEELAEVAIVVLIVIVVGLMIVSLIVTAISYAYSAFVGNPFDVGAKRFYLTSLKTKAQVGEVGFAFDNNYKNVTKIMFFRMLYTTLWSLLFVIPGIVKAYEYQMIPYLLAENPNLTKEQAFSISKQMMNGNKWKAFVLDLSFMGWDILSSFTAGILGFFYVDPYKNLTLAALYEELSLINGRPGIAQPTPNVETVSENPYEQPVYGAPVSNQVVPPVPENFK